MMELVSNLADVKEGDTVVASGTDGIFPAGFPIGQVASVERAPGLYLSILVRPAVNFSSLDNVLVVMVPPRSATPEAAAAPPAPAAGVK
jgi:rod shape-determining protein MreC